MKLLAYSLILIAALGTATWNIHIKKSENSLVFVTLMVIPQCLISLPIIFLVPLPDWQSLCFIFVSSIFQTTYILTLNTAYKHGMITKIYPLALGLAPIISLIFWHLMLKQQIDFLEFVGIIIISIGVLSFVVFGRNIHMAPKGYLYAIITSILIFLYSLTDTFGIRLTTNMLTYVSWLFTIKAFILLIPMFLLQKLRWHDIRTKKNYIMAGLLAGFGYTAALFAFIYGPTPTILALRSSSIWFVFLLSILFLKEKFSLQSFLQTLIISVGIILILTS